MQLVRESFEKKRFQRFQGMLLAEASGLCKCMLVTSSCVRFSDVLHESSKALFVGCAVEPNILGFSRCCETVPCRTVCDKIWGALQEKGWVYVRCWLLRQLVNQRRSTVKKWNYNEVYGEEGGSDKCEW